jgi:hypothetical protein
MCPLFTPPGEGMLIIKAFLLAMESAGILTFQNSIYIPSTQLNGFPLATPSQKFKKRFSLEKSPVI